MNCSYESQYGEIVSNWKIEADQFEWDVTIPANSTATVYIPGKEISVEGVEPSQLKEMTFLHQEKGCSVFKIESGNYLFNSEL